MQERAEDDYRAKGICNRRNCRVVIEQFVNQSRGTVTMGVDGSGRGDITGFFKYVVHVWQI